MAPVKGSSRGGHSPPSNLTLLTAVMAAHSHSGSPPCCPHLLLSGEALTLSPPLVSTYCRCRLHSSSPPGAPRRLSGFSHTHSLHIQQGAEAAVRVLVS